MPYMVRKVIGKDVNRQVTIPAGVVLRGTAGHLLQQAAQLLAHGEPAPAWARVAAGTEMA